MKSASSLSSIDFKRKFILSRKYATHLFTTPLSHVISDNMMSRLILTLTEQISNNPLTRIFI